ncbi:MAG: hypothetical protein GY711_23140 [bacterium]|nr:hypothetical protein [bacterium]
MNTAAHRLTLPVTAAILLFLGAAYGTEDEPREDKFRQLDELLPTPNAYRTASGAPGHAYWQQGVDYEIEVRLDEKTRRIEGRERITYTNNSPDSLSYLWVQLDPNIHSPQSHSHAIDAPPELEKLSFDRMASLLAKAEFDGGCSIDGVRGKDGNDLPHTIVDTMMRVDLPLRLDSGMRTELEIDWSYTVNESKYVRGRTGAEFFEDDGNWIFEIAQWFPRLAAYTDATGWQNKPFLGSGEFTLEFGDYLVSITVPDDHVVASTGVLENPDDVLRPEWRERLAQARAATEPVFIVTPDEAAANEKSDARGEKTWVFRAENVRDFAWASSPKFLWDAMGVNVPGKGQVMAMSFFPKEGEPLWHRYSTHAVAHTLEFYSRYTVPYPYAVAISVNGPVGGMEYPMICFNGPRPEEDGTYDARTKYGLISVIIHEVGHNWFPMIINSDERQWTWMDEGLNSFVQYLAEQEWEEDYPSRSGEPQSIVEYMQSTEQVPIMTNSESILQFGNNAYAKPATALNVLRETVMGRELFDFAFKTYSRRWQFKRPEPADLFRTLEDASAVDLDWFWRGWFYSTDKTDLALTGLRRFRVDSQDPDDVKGRAREKREAEPTTLAQARNAELAKRIDRFTDLRDFYNQYDELDVTERDREAFRELLAGLTPEQRRLLELDLNFYVVELANEGGLPMPVVLEVHYTDETHEELRSPAEIWRKNGATISRLVMTEKEIERLVLDPHLETADVDLTDNHWPRRTEIETILLEKEREPSSPMRDAGEGSTPEPKYGDGDGDESVGKATDEAGALRFTVTAPDARGPLFVAGSFNGWQPGDQDWRLEPENGGSAGHWTLSVARDELGEQPSEWKLTRGSWATVEVRADHSERTNRTLAADTGEVRVAVAAWADDRDAHASEAGTVTGGRLDVLDVRSEALGNTRKVRVWLPEHYDHAEHAKRRYPVLYMHDGQNVLDASTSFLGIEWGADEALAKLSAAGHVDPWLVVAIDNAGADRSREYNPPFTTTGGVANRGDLYLEFLTRELMPRIESRYRVRTGPASTALGGSSYGGSITLYAALEHPDVFGALLVESPAAWTHERKLLERCAANGKWPQRVFVGVGTRESSNARHQAEYLRTARVLREALEQSGLGEDRARVVIEEGATHSETAWAGRLESALAFLLAR